jgi:hypothetical protein
VYIKIQFQVTLQFNVYFKMRIQVIGSRGVGKRTFLERIGNGRVFSKDSTFVDFDNYPTVSLFTTGTTYTPKNRDAILFLFDNIQSLKYILRIALTVKEPYIFVYNENHNYDSYKTVANSLISDYHWIDVFSSSIVCLKSLIEKLLRMFIPERLEILAARVCKPLDLKQLPITLIKYVHNL